MTNWTNSDNSDSEDLPLWPKAQWEEITQRISTRLLVIITGVFLAISAGAYSGCSPDSPDSPDSSGASGASNFLDASSPEDSLRRLAEAYQNHDLPAFEKYVDINRLTEKFVEDSLDFAKAVQAAYYQKNGIRQEWSALGARRAEEMKPELIGKIRGQLRRDVVEWNEDPPQHKTGGPVNIFLGPDTKVELVSANEDGNFAHATILFISEG